MLGHHQQCWHNNKTTLVQCLVFAGLVVNVESTHNALNITVLLLNAIQLTLYDSCIFCTKIKGYNVDMTHMTIEHIYNVQLV